VTCNRHPCDTIYECVTNTVKLVYKDYYKVVLDYCVKAEQKINEEENEE